MAELRRWLAGLGLERYAATFEAEEIDLDGLRHLAESDLEKLGLPMGPRKKLLAAIGELGATPPAPAPAAVGQAERRQITVMFCDLVGSTALSESLDPEDLRALMTAYQKAAGEVVAHYDGHIAQYLGDGIMAYFGWPAAHEDDAERAVRAGLDIIESVKPVRAPAPLTVRIGIATGAVVVGESGGDGAEPKLAIGETPNLAARLQGLAEPDQIVIAPATRRLVGGAFDLVDFGERTLKGIIEPVRAWRIEGLATTEGRFEAAHGGHLTPLVGREAEIAMLLERWRQAKDGEGQVVLLAGEPGIGKSRLMRVLREHIATEPHTRLRYQCSPYHASSALHPVIEQFERAASFARGDSADAKLDKMEALLAQGTDDVRAVAPLFAALVSLDASDRYPPLKFSPQKQKEMTLAALAAQVVGLAARQPVLMLFEDAHWIDPTSQQTLDLIVPTIAGHRVLLVITYRPEYQPPWTGLGHVTPLTLTRLGRRQAAEMVDKVTGGVAIPAVVLDQIVAKTDGVPLFVEELTKTVLEAGFLEDRGARYELAGPLPPLAIPATLQDSLMARLDRLSPVKEVAQIGACIGREFSYELLAAVSPLRDNELEEALQQLVNSELIFRRGTPPDATYTFKHALVQDTAYGSLLKARRQRLHAEIAQRLEGRPGADGASPPELLAHHFGRAELLEKAVHYWRRAGDAAAQRAANTEAAEHFSQALRIVREHPDLFGDQSELEILLCLGPPLLAAKGWSTAEVGEVYERARAIARLRDDVAKVIPPLVGVWVYRFSRAEFEATAGVAKELLDIARRLEHADLRLQAHHAAWPTPMVLGDFVKAHDHIEKGLRLYDYERHHGHAFIYMGHDPAVCGYALDSLVAWALGYPDTATEHANAALDLARRMRHPPSLAHGLWYACKFRIASGDIAGTLALADELLTLCEEHRLLTPAYFGSRAFKGWALARSGDAALGIPMMEAALADWRSTGGRNYVQHRMSLLADAHVVTGDFERAADFIDQAFDIAAATGERWFEAELHLLRAEIALRMEPSQPDAAEMHLTRALACSRGQSARSWELRAATSLARLWQSQGKARKAYELLAPLYGWFTEGFDTADLIEAKALLDELRPATRRRSH